MEDEGDKMRVIQLNSCLCYGDAITHHTFEIDKTLKDLGFETNIFSETIDSNFHEYKFKLPKNVEYDKNFKKYIDDKECLLIYHYSVFCENINLYKESKNKKILVYHNITPPEYFTGYDDYIENICRKGRKELLHLSKCEMALGDSEYNRKELVKYGFEEDKTDVLPIFLSLGEFDKLDLNKKLIDYFNDDFVNMLFVGRVAPNKKIEDLIKTFYYYNKAINPKSRLFLVGPLFLNKYNGELQNIVNKLGLNKNITFTNRVSFSDLKTYYKLANIFISMSEHEGFCVPLLESMYFKNPIVAYNSTAIPYTLGKAGILINEKKYEEIAEIINLVVKDKPLRDRIIKNQDERLKDLELKSVKRKLKEIIEKVIR